METITGELPHFLSFKSAEWSLLRFECRPRNVEYLNLCVRLCQTAAALSLPDPEQGEADISPNDRGAGKVAVETHGWRGGEEEGDIMLGQWGRGLGTINHLE